MAQGFYNNILIKIHKWILAWNLTALMSRIRQTRVCCSTITFFLASMGIRRLFDTISNPINISKAYHPKFPLIFRHHIILNWESLTSIGYWIFDDLSLNTQWLSLPFETLKESNFQQRDVEDLTVISLPFDTLNPLVVLNHRQMSCARTQNFDGL